MAYMMRALTRTKPTFLGTLLNSFHRRHMCSTSIVNELSRVLSDHRKPKDDLELALSSFASQITPTLVEQLLKRCKNLSHSAHRFYLWAEQIPGFQHSPESFHILVDVLGQSKQFAILWDLLIDSRDSERFEVSPDIFWLVFRSYSRADLPDDAIRAFNRMPEFGINPSVDDLDELMFSLCKRKHVICANEFFEKIKYSSGIDPTVKTYTILIQGWGDIADSKNPRNLFEEMLDRKLPVDVQAYNSYLEALYKGGDAQLAKEVFKEMGARGLTPDVATYAVFIRASCEADELHSAFKVLATMRRGGLVPNVFTYNCLIKKLCKFDKVDEAYSLLKEMRQNFVEPDVWTYKTILAFHCVRCEVNLADRILLEMEKSDKVKPDKQSYNMLLKMMINVGRFDRVTKVWERMTEKGCLYPSVSTYAVMVHGLCKKFGKTEMACKYFEEMVDEGIPPYFATVEVLRNRLLQFRMYDKIEILASKMELSTCRSTQEMSGAMRGVRDSMPPAGIEINVDSD